MKIHHLIKTTHKIFRTLSISLVLKKQSRHFTNVSKFQSTAITETATYETMSDTVIDNICTSFQKDVKEIANILGNKIKINLVKKLKLLNVLILFFRYNIVYRII